MATVAFTANNRDHSNDTGYQWEFLCDKCGNGVMTSFQASKMGMASGFLKAAGGLLGGRLSSLGHAGDQIKDTLRGKARDEAFAKAVEEGKKSFKQCSRCGHWVCPEHCWNHKAGLCESCAPDLEEEAAAARATAVKEQVWEKARNTNLVADVNIAQAAPATCPSCGAKAAGSKFCPECGKPLSAKVKCAQCGKEAQAGTKFCPDCGGKIV